MREAVSVGWRGGSCWVGAWDHVRVKMPTSEHLVSVASPFAMVRARGGSQGSSPLHFDDEQGPRVTFRRLLASGVSRTYVFTPLSTPFPLE